MQTQLDFFGKAIGGQQADLFVKTLVQSAEAPSASSTCATCGEALPPRARCCPNCYAPIGNGKGKGGD